MADPAAPEAAAPEAAAPEAAAIGAAARNARLEGPLRHQPRARATLTAALSGDPAHAYLFRGPRGAGKRAAARAFAAEILATGADEPEAARRRALLDPSPHPDLVWLAPRGAQHLVEEVREQVIRAASLRPFEGTRRVFVIESAEALRDESQNALLKTLEEPPAFAHLVLITSEPSGLLETVASRCAPVDFQRLPAEAVEAALAGSGEPEHLSSAARLAAGDLVRARFLLAEPGRELRAAAEKSVTAAAEGELGRAPWKGILSIAEADGEEAGAEARRRIEIEVSEGAKWTKRDIEDEAKRAARRRRTDVLDLGLDLCASWLRDLAAAAAGAPEVVFNRDRAEALADAAQGVEVAAARKGVELVQDTRRRLDLNVSEELALEALFFRLERVLHQR